MTKRIPKSPKQEAEYTLVYSTDPRPPPCPKCKNQKDACTCPMGLSVGPYQGPFNPHVRVERKGRGGKTVTLIYDLPAHEGLLKELCTHCKRSLGVGGTWYTDDGQGFLEVQGDHRSKVEAILRTFNNQSG